MELVRPEPRIINGRPRYTLTSYDPVSVEVEVPYATGPNVIFAQQAAEQQKAVKCAEALAQRLMQRIPDAAVAQSREAVVSTFKMSLQMDGLSERDFLEQSGMTRADLAKMFDNQAMAAAKQQAAIDAWAAHHKLTVQDAELPAVMGFPPGEDFGAILEEARRTGKLEQLYEVALRNKAMGMILDECECTYTHETAAEAAARAARMQAAAPAPQKRKYPHLKLV